MNRKGTRKLSLAKETVRTLTREAMDSVAGGTFGSIGCASAVKGGCGGFTGRTICIECFSKSPCPGDGGPIETIGK